VRLLFVNFKTNTMSKANNRIFSAMASASAKLLFACVSLALSLTTQAQITQAQERPSLDGLTFPQPVVGSKLVAEGARRWPTRLAQATLKFDIDKKGKVKQVALDYLPQDSGIFNPFRNSIKNLRFLPAEYQGKKIEFSLAGVLIIRSLRNAAPELILPVNEQGLFKSSGLASESALASGIQFAQVTSFPSYFFVEPERSADTARVPALAPGWAEYQPMLYDGDPVQSSLLLVVRYFTELSYPTGKWTGAKPDTSDRVLEYVRVQSYPNAPLLALDPEIRLGLSRVISSEVDTLWQSVQALLAVEKSGRVELGPIRGAAGRSRSAQLRKSLERLRFYPALAFHISDQGAFERLDTLFSSGRVNLRALDSASLQARTSFLTIVR
jgi:hypothetical protein